MIVSDNGTEFTSNAILVWQEEQLDKATYTGGRLRSRSAAAAKGSLIVLNNA
jgi:hypothetical protein